MAWLVGIAVAILVILVAVIAVLPLGLFRAPAARLVSAALGRTVTIGGLTRLDTFSLTPTMKLTDVRIVQPAWAGAGDMVHIGDARVRFAALALLRGKFEPIDVDIGDATAVLVRDARGRSNWAGEPKRDAGGPPRAGSAPALHHLGVTRSSLTLTDAKRHITLAATVAADARGLVITGHGTHRGTPLTLVATGGALTAIDPAARYPFAARIVSPLVALAAHGTMDHVLDTGHFTAAITTHGDDLKVLDDIIEAGVPATQNFVLAAAVRHDDYDWGIGDLKGTIGRSDLAGSLSVKRRAGRSILDGRMMSHAMDFNDLASDEQLARGRAEQARIGKRIVPSTEIHFEKLANTDGVIHVTIAKLLSDEPSPFVALDATLTLDHRQLTVRPLTARLTHGTLGGEISVEHRSGDPKLTVTLDLVGARIEDLFAIPPKRATVPVAGRIRLHGTGRTVREALGRGDGTIDLFGRGGGMDYKVATLAAGDVVRGIGLAVGVDASDRLAPIRCIDARFVAKDGLLTARDLMLDTSLMRAGGDGTLRLPDEALALTLHGRSKHPDIVQSTVPIHISGTLANARFDVVPVDRSPLRKGLFGQIGVVLKSLKLRSDPGRAEAAPDAPCDALAAASLGADWARRHPG